MTIGLPRLTVRLVPFDEAWAAEFTSEAARLQALLGKDTGPIEHIGSTAVPGICAKPIIDMMAGVGSLESARSLSPALQAAGYEYRENGDAPDRILFVKGPPICRTHHLSLVVRGSAQWNNCLRFRDALRSDRTLAEEYERLKRNLAAKFSSDRPSYTAAKEEFILRVIRNSK